jgi:predicted lipoprotein with Yx(FWY)xxD motif
MFRKHVVSLAALMTAGVALLSACGNEVSGAPTSSAPATVDAPVDQQAGQSELEGLFLDSGTAKANKAPQGTGDWATGDDGTPNTAARDTAEKWVELRASRAGDLNPVLVNGAGLTLYRFDNDSNKPPKSTCNGDCAKTWPPLTVARGGKIFLAGVKKSAVGVVKRDDGRLQVTVDGWAVYRFNKDKKPGDTLGQGVGGTWFGVRPDGGKAGVQDGGNAGNNGGNNNGGGNGPKATSVILFDDANFSDNGASQGVGGAGCQNLGRPDITSSLTANGSLKIWTDKDCRGTSAVVDGDVTDLSTVTAGRLNFDNTIASVFIG